MPPAFLKRGSLIRYAYFGTHAAAALTHRLPLSSFARAKRRVDDFHVCDCALERNGDSSNASHCSRKCVRLQRVLIYRWECDRALVVNLWNGSKDGIYPLAHLGTDHEQASVLIQKIGAMSFSYH
jgi:hypothetical protein